MKRESHSGASPPSSSSSVPLALTQEVPATCSTTSALVTFRAPAAGSPEPSCVASRMEGSERAKTVMIRRPLLVTAATLLNFCSLCLMPPTTKAEPSTKSRLESTEPSMDTCTMRMRPSCRAKMQSTSSVTLPKEALSRPPIVWFVYLATSSVTKETRSAKGTKASRAKTKTYTSPQLLASATKAKGVKTRRQFSLLPSRISVSVVCR
mmetsp:Transcript_75653/g.229284  ORF Transcript_75653/g.229284 Transcript_75653/m.229284 type:complete len:208 (-) Transcript_75653:278-901(-)